MSRYNLAWMISVPLAMLVAVSLSFTAPSRQNDKANELVRRIQGGAGTKVTLTGVHEGLRQPETITVVRAKIEVPTVLGLNRKADNLKEFEWFADNENGIGYIRVIQFTEHTADDIKK